MLVHKNRRAFFFQALEREDDGPSVAEDAMEGGLWRESGKAVKVAELSKAWHEAKIMRKRAGKKPTFPGNNQASMDRIGKNKANFTHYRTRRAFILKLLS